MKPDILYICDKRRVCAAFPNCAANGGDCNYTTHEDHRAHKMGTSNRFEYVPGQPDGFIRELEEDAT